MRRRAGALASAALSAARSASAGAPPDAVAAKQRWMVSRSAIPASNHRQGGAEGGRQGQRRPGLRADYGPNYYAAFTVDPDGYRIEAWCGKKS
jgi:hypothetical protein